MKNPAANKAPVFPAERTASASPYEVGVNVPVVVRLEGNNAPLGREILANSSLNIIAAQTLTDAAVKSVKAANGHA